MIIFEQTFRDLLIRTNLDDRRVFLMRGPQAPADQMKAPYIVFFQVAPVDPLGLKTMTGPLDQQDRLYQVSIFDSSQSRAIAIGDSVRMYLDTMHGDFENVRIGHSFYITQTWGWEPDTELFQVIQEYRIMFRYLNYDPPVTPTATRKGATTHGNRNER